MTNSTGAPRNEPAIKAILQAVDSDIPVQVGGGMGRTPAIGSVIAEFVPWQQILVYIEAIVRVYNRFGRRDNQYKARIKILVKAEGPRFASAVDEEFRREQRERVKATRLFRDALDVMLERVPRGLDVTAVGQSMAAVVGVKGIHDLHIWAMSTTETASQCSRPPRSMSACPRPEYIP